MATYNFHILMMGKEEIDIFVSPWGYFDFFTEVSSTFNKIFVQIAEFDWLPGRQKRLFSREKNSSVRFLRLMLVIHMFYSISLFVNCVFVPVG